MTLLLSLARYCFPSAREAAGAGLDVTRLIRVVMDVSKNATHAMLDVLGPGGKYLLDARFVTFRSS
jgi:hypothetical protein